MSLLKINLKYMPNLLAFFIFLMLLTRLVYFFVSPQSDLIGVIPDDAFYYIQMAAHRSRDGFWTFDGTSPATGFHFLYGYFLFFIFEIYPGINWIGLYLIVGIFSCFAISASVYLLSRAVTEIYGGNVALAAVLPFLGFTIIMQSTIMMESWLVIFFSSITIFLIARQNDPSSKFVFFLFLVGFFGSLSRTDYGMLPGVLFFTIYFSDKLKITPAVIRSFAILLGASFGVFLVFLQNYYISGQFSQASAQIKFFWSSVAGHNILAPLQLILSIAFPSFDFIDRQSKLTLLVISFLFLTYALIKSIRVAKSEKRSLPLVLLLGCMLTLVGYVLFYRHNSWALQSWYSSNLVAPISILMGAVFHFLFSRRALIPAVIAFGIYLFSGLSSIFSIQWPHQAGMMNAGVHARALSSYATYSAWNAGIISYFSGKPLVNIDGLTNDEILPYIKNNKLMDYLKIKKIDYIVDYKEMIDNQSLRLRGGYDDERVFRCLTSIGPVDGESPGWGGSKLTLFKVDIPCL